MAVLDLIQSKITNPLLGGTAHPNPTILPKQFSPEPNNSGPWEPSYSPASSTTTAAAPDPYAKYGGQTAYNNLVSGYDTQKQGVINSAATSASNAHGSLSGSILDLIDSLTSGQNKINADATQNYLAKQQGTAGVLSMVQHGIQSGGVTLANKNATNSSAAQALARAYGDIGRRAQSQVGNQFAQGQNNINQQQQQQGMLTNQGVRHIQQAKTDTINNIVADASNKLSAIESAMVGASLPDRINLQQEQQNIRNTASAALADLDTQLSQGVGGINPNSEDARRTAAAGLAAAGTAPENSFQFDTSPQAQFQGTGPFASELPLFTMPGAKRQGSMV